MKKKPRLIVIGLDGATWNVIRPLVDKGKLPTFKRIMKNGTTGILKSTIPPVTFPAWQSMFTGLNPGKLGVFDFVQVDISRYKYVINSPKSFKNKGFAVWNILSKFGFKSAVINIPTASISKINGIMIGGPFSNQNTLVYPKNMKNLLRRFNYESYNTDLSKQFLKTHKDLADDTKKIEEMAKSTISSRFKIAKYILTKEAVDFLAFTVFLIDNIQHYFWGEPIIEELWRFIDEEIDDLLNYTSTSDHVFICSDHGFTKIRKVFYVSRFLQQKGYLQLKKISTQRLFNLIPRSLIMNSAKKTRIAPLLRKFFDFETLAFILGHFPAEQGRIGGSGLTKIIDWQNSKCVPMSTELYLNCSAIEKERLADDLSNELVSLMMNGERLFSHVYKKEEIYSGKYIQKAPDLILKPNDGVRVLESLFPKRIAEKNVSFGWKGCHTRNGIFLAIGPRFSKGKTIDANILDIAPTILNFYHIIPPSQMDGIVLTNLFNTQEKHHQKRLQADT